MSITNVTRCDICNCIVYEDGTVEDCAGECGREICKDSSYVPLSFDDEGVLRDLPDLDAPEWDDNYEEVSDE